MPKFDDTEIYGDLKVTGKAELSEDSHIENKKIATENYVTTAVANIPAAIPENLISGSNTNASLIAPIDFKGAVDAITRGHIDTAVKLVRARVGNAVLTKVAATGGSITTTENINQYDTIMIEVNTDSSSVYNSNVIAVSINKNTTASSDGRNSVSWSTWDGTDHKLYSFIVERTGAKTLYFSNLKYLTTKYNGTTITHTTGTFELYVGRIWRLGS